MTEQNVPKIIVENEEKLDNVLNEQELADYLNGATDVAEFTNEEIFTEGFSFLD